MTLEEFMESVDSDNAPPPDLSAPLQALWHAQKNNWEQAHTIAQSISSPDGGWIHAHLHRDEGDLSNARYWYSRSGHQESRLSIQEERVQIIKALLKT